MARSHRPMTIVYEGLEATFDMPGWYAAGSPNGIHTGEDLRISGRHLATLKARHAGLHTPDEVRQVREKLGLSQREAGRLIGGGPNAFQKYESGEVMVSRSISNLLFLLESNPADLATLRRHHSAGEPA